MEWIPAKWYTPTNGRQITLVVIHRMEAPDKPTTAEATARFFQNLPSDRKASAHRCYDSDSVVQCVHDKDIAYHAPGANHNGLGFELAGYSKDDDWSAPTIENMLRMAARDTAEAAADNNFPLIWRNWQDLRAGLTFGVTDHWEVTQAWHLTDHTDPGPSFPVGRFMEMCKAAPAAPQTSAPAAGGFLQGVDLEIDHTTIMSQISAKECGLGDVGWYELIADGGVKAQGGAKFYGGYFNLPAENRNTDRLFISITPKPDGPGYVINSLHDGAHYAFAPGLYGF